MLALISPRGFRRLLATSLSLRAPVSCAQRRVDLPRDSRHLRDRRGALGGDVPHLKSAQVSCRGQRCGSRSQRSEEHTSELQSRQYLVCRLLLEKKKKK